MENVTITSRKKELKKLFTILSVTLAIVLIVFVIMTTITFNNYLGGQKLAVKYMTSATDMFDEYSGSTLVREIYDYLNPSYDPNYGRYGIDKKLGEMLTSEGYVCYFTGSEYLEYTNYFEYIFGKEASKTWGTILIITIIIALATYRWFDQKSSISIQNEFIICKNITGKTKQLLLGDVKSVESAPFNGLKIKSSGVNFTICYLKNAAEIKNHLLENLSAVKHNPTTDNVPEKAVNIEIEGLEKYKSLLDSGIITQEEFDAKKKQILGL